MLHETHAKNSHNTKTYLNHSNKPHVAWGLISQEGQVSQHDWATCRIFVGRQTN